MDEVLFKSLYNRCFGKVFRFISRHTHDNLEAEDLTHDVFLRFWNYRASFAANIPAEAQLLVIARRTVINNYRKGLLRKLTSIELLDTDIKGAEDADFVIRDAQVNEQLQVALDLLPPKRREIFQKSRFQVMTYEEIARDMGISSSTVESQMVKALKFLRERLADLMMYLLWVLFY